VPISKNARNAVMVAIEKGLLIPPEACQLCGRRTWERREEDVSGKFKKRFFFARNTVKGLVAHHWNGYSKENWLAVWFICRGCNRKLHDKHDGTLTIEEARIFVSRRRRG
jgi:hypothetical protein